VLHTTDHFASNALTTVEGFPGDGTQTVPNYVGGDFVYLLCTHSSACKVGFIS